VGVGDVGVVEYGEVGECGRGVFCVGRVGMGLQKDFSNTLTPKLDFTHTDGV